MSPRVGVSARPSSGMRLKAWFSRMGLSCPKMVCWKAMSSASVESSSKQASMVCAMTCSSSTGCRKRPMASSCPSRKLDL
ncbi:Uncharacterised protein [Mycobacterium tuberculosis]|nr:Uncharacterised protein [Mycobacterium tuberculosis]